MKSTFFCILFLLILHCAAAQIPPTIFNGDTGEEYDSKNFSSKKLPLKDRAGVYHFGESEGEWDLVVAFHQDSLILQLWEGAWKMDAETKKETWLRTCATYNSIKIQNNRFYFGRYSGLFAEQKTGNTNNKVVLLFCNPTEGRVFVKDSAEMGYFNSSLKTFFNQYKYGLLSLKVQGDEYFSGKSKQELKMMRNEIMAKYGFIFQKGGDMEKYFRKQEWYRPFLKDVSQCLSSIEQQNLQKIIRFEQGF